MAQNSLSPGAITEKTETVLQVRCLSAANSRKTISLPAVAQALHASVGRVAPGLETDSVVKEPGDGKSSL